MFVRSVQVCLELSIFIFLTQISHQSFNSHSDSHHTVGALNTSSCFIVVMSNLQASNNRGVPSVAQPSVKEPGDPARLHYYVPPAIYISGL